MNSTRKRKQHGFTLVELTASISVSAVVLLATMSLMNIMTRQWTQGKDRRDMESETTLATERIVREVRSAQIDSISISSATGSGSDTLKIGGGKRFFKNAAGDLEFVDSAAPMTYLNGMVTGFTATKPYVTPAGDTLINAIHVTMTMQNHTMKDTTSAIAVPRIP